MLKRGLVIMMLATLVACQSQSTDSDDPSQYWGGTDAATVDERLVTADNTFGLKLLRELADAAPGENLFISPTSVAMALTMTYNGASGETQAAMADALAINGLTLQEVNEASQALRLMLEDPEPDVRLDIANSLWARDGIPFEEDFLERNRQYFAAEVTTLDFASPDAAPTINGWVDDKTEGRITEIVDDPIDPDAILFLINAIYFKGTWTYKFDPEETSERPFGCADGSTAMVPMMEQADGFRYLEGDGFNAVRLPYGSERMGMYLFLPDEDVGLNEIIGVVDAATWDTWIGQFETQMCGVMLPRISLEYEQSLKNSLIALGMGLAFSDEAEFSQMTSLPVKISDVRHKTFLQIDEEGTEAAAVTSVESQLLSDPRYPVLRFNRPFLCAIVDDGTGAILFVGAVSDPS
ncbi:MAG TPA: serpin family protein [Acidobacteriota bacterium]|nr:serpin family protein [Acidobacteriota bacterium]